MSINKHGTLKILGPIISDTEFTLTAKPLGFSINITLVGLTAATSNPTTINAGEEKILTFYADGTLFETMDAGSWSRQLSPNATCSYEKSSDTECKVKISNAHGDVAFQLEGTRIGWTIVPTLTNLITTPGKTNPTTIAKRSTAVLYYTASTNYSVPTRATSIIGATGSYRTTSTDTCVITLANPTSTDGKVTFELVGTLTYYPIVSNLSNMTSSENNPDRMPVGGEVTLNYIADDGFEAPATRPTVTGATIESYERAAGTDGLSTVYKSCTLKLKDVTGNVSILMEATAASYSVNVNPVHIKANPYNPEKVYVQGQTIFTFYTDGANYYVPEDSSYITVLNATIYNYEKVSNTTCKLTLSDPTGIVSIGITGKLIDHSGVNALCITTRGPNKIRFCNYGNVNANLYYLKNSTFTEYTFGTWIELDSTDSCFFNGNNEYFSRSANQYIYFESENRVEISGNIMSLLDPEATGSTVPRYCFYKLFANSKITEPPTLPAVNLSWHCYDSMFYNCSNLFEAPALPATILSDYCYKDMFYGCSMLANTPRLSAAVLATSCYSGMFQNSGIDSVPTLSASNLKTYCYAHMFEGCANLRMPMSSLPADTLVTGCYEEMFKNCISLKQTPLLVATVAAYKCCYGMFEGCTHLLITQEALSFISTAEYSLSRMFYGCSAITFGPSVLAASILTAHCYDSMFENCISLLRPIEINVAEINDYSCNRMFYGCSSIRMAEKEYESLGYTIPYIIKCTGSISDTAVENMFTSISSMSIWSGGTPVVNKTYYLYDDGTESIYLSSDSTFTIAAESNARWNGLLYYSTDGNAYLPWNGETISSSTASTHKLYLRGIANTFIKSTDAESAVFKITGSNISISGQLFSLLDYRNPKAVSVSANTFFNMFYGCTSLTDTSELIIGYVSTKFAAQSCYGMFDECSNLISAPQLPSKLEGAYGCYERMFRNCTSLETPPELPSIKMGIRQYATMFKGCISLTSTPKLEATQLASNCYVNMFYGCTNLGAPADLPATELPAGCYKNMFRDCTGILLAESESTKYYKPYRVPKSGTGSTSLQSVLNMFENTGGTFKGTPEINKDYYIADNYELLPYIVFSSTGSFSMRATDHLRHVYTTDKIEYSYDTITWQTWENWKTFISSGANNKLYLRGIFKSVGSLYFGKNDKSSDPEQCFIFTGENISVVGKLTYLVDYKKELTTYYFYRLFYNISNIVNISNLILDTVCSLRSNNGIYHSLFEKCTSIIIPPELPATTLADGCYAGMFKDCTSLTTPPALPATTLADGCYAGMFSGCTSLTRFPALPATTLTDGCYDSMFEGCTSIILSPELPAIVLAESCYADMFSGCTSLVSAPQLVVEELANKCYDSMFKGCTSLVNAPPELPATTIASSCYKQMFYGCTSLLNIPSKLPAKTLYDACYYSMFEGCTALVSMPELPATTLASECYYRMFYGCTSLINNILELPAKTLYDACYYSMFEGCTSLVSAPNILAETFNTKEYKLNSSWDEASCAMMFYGCTSLKNGPEALNFVEISQPYMCTCMFANCTSLTTAPELPATTLAEGCYQSMFANCTSLTTAPELPATTLAEGCYQSMFANCTSLTTAPELPATTLAEQCYSNMFINCTSLVNAPAELPATVLVERCYESMFNGCTSLVSSPQILAETTASYCCCMMFNRCSALVNASAYLYPGFLDELCYNRMFYGCTSLISTPTISISNFKGSNALSMMFYGCKNLKNNFIEIATTCEIIQDSTCYEMFYNCTSLITAPELPATTLAEHCYTSMFEGCTSLVNAPELPATTLANGCYASMFRGCTSLINAPELPATTLADYCYGIMFYGCTSLVSAPELSATILAKGCYNYMFSNCTSLVNAPSELPASELVEYCYREMFYECTSLVVSPKIKTTSLGNYCCYKMFYGCKSLTGVYTGITTDVTLNSTEAGEHCCDEMYRGCSTLRIAPILPVTILADYCYNYMFKGCTSLVNAPELPATVLADYCYNYMFYGCTSLVNVSSELPATTLRTHCYEDMFHGCTSLVNAPGLPATTLAESCYSGMFYGCTSLVNVPSELPATTLAESCYSGMFYGCTSLVNVPSELPATTLAYKCYAGMFSSCTSLVNAPKLSATTLETYCYSTMFENCISLTTAPELPATKLARYCYSGMFYGCTSLVLLNVHFSVWSSNYSPTYRWVQGVNSSGNFICPIELPVERGVSRIPYGWTINGS